MGEVLPQSRKPTDKGRRDSGGGNHHPPAMRTRTTSRCQHCRGEVQGVIGSLHSLRVIFQKIPSNYKGKKIKVTVEKPDRAPLMRQIEVNISRNRTRVPPDRVHQGEHGSAKEQVLNPTTQTHSQTNRSLPSDCMSALESQC